MAFRILPTGVVETDTPAEVVSLFGEMGISFPPNGLRGHLLPAGQGEAQADIVVEAVRPRRTPAPKRSGSPRAAVPSGGKRQAPRAGESDKESSIRLALEAGPVTPRALWRWLGVDPHVGRGLLRPLLERGVVCATGSTLSRQFSLGPGRAPRASAGSKEGIDDGQAVPSSPSRRGSVVGGGGYEVVWDGTKSRQTGERPDGCTVEGNAAMRVVDGGLI